MDDLNLVQNILKGDDSAFELLLKKYQLEISKYVYSNIRDNETTKDIVQDIFISVYNKLYTFDQKYKFKTWLYTIARNKCIDYIRKNKQALIDSDSSVDLVESKEACPSTIAEFNETKSSISAFIKTLDEKNKQLLYLKYYHSDMNFNDIGRILKISEAATKSRYYSLYKRYINFLNKSNKIRGERFEMQ